MNPAVPYRFWIVLLTLAAFTAEATPPEDGIYADFSTRLGSFTCKLDPLTAPMAVANFVGLATGQKHWKDPNTGLVKLGKFYDGLIFHRVITNFVIQGGSPRGDGSDGPGYAFPDEFSPSQRHDGPGVLSMANSGPRSNGSQFFVTVAATPWLDDLHTIFGRVVSGQSVVEAISLVERASASVPLVPVVIDSVIIRRVGTEAAAFDIQAQGLPVVSAAPVDLVRSPSEVSVTYSNRQFGHYALVSATEVGGPWHPLEQGINLGAPDAVTLTTNAISDSGFYSLTEVLYPSSTFAPRTIAGREFFWFLGGATSVTITFDANGTGTYSGVGLNGPPSGTVTGYSWVQFPYRGVFNPVVLSGYNPLFLRLDFSSPTGGNVAADAGGGPFTLTP